MKTNLGHSILPHDATEPVLMSPGIKQVPTFSYMLNFGSCKPVPAESGNLFHSLVSAPPAMLQHDFQELSTRKSSSVSYYPGNSYCNTGTVPIWPSLQSNESLNPSGPTPRIDMHPGLPCRPTMSSSNYGIHGQYNDLDSLRAVISHAGSRIENGSSALLGGLNCPSRGVDGEMSNGTNGNSMREASLQAPSSIATKQTSVGSGCPRVFCMSACGDLLLSNTGLLGILCSCHGLHMSVSNFCEHSGLSDVNPGYAVRMDTGECIAQWRKLYLQNFGIRAPDDHRGWEWPEGLLKNSSQLRSNVAVPLGNKVFDLSGLFTSPAELVKSSQSRNNVFQTNPQLSQESANKMPKTEQVGNGWYQQHFHMSQTDIPRRNSQRMADKPLLPCRDASSLMASRASVEGGLRNNCQASSFRSNIISTSENSFSLPYQNMQSFGSKTHNNLKDEIVLQKGASPSSIELKLGQPSQQGWGVGSTTLSVMGSNIRDSQTTFQEQLIDNLGKSKVVEHGNQHLYLHPASHLRQSKEQSLLDLLNNTPSSVNDTSSSKHMRDGLFSSSEISVPFPLSNSLAGASSVFHKENDKGIDESHHFIPWRPSSQPQIDKSRLQEYSCNGGDGLIRPLGIKELDLQKKGNSNMTTRCGHYSNVGSESSFRLYVQQMENSGFFTKVGKPSHPNSCTVADEKVSSLGMPGTLPDAYRASNHVGNAFRVGSIPDPGHVSSSLGYGALQTLQASSFCSTPFTVVQGPGHDSASLHKDVHVVNPCRSDETLRVPALRNTYQSLKGTPADASIGLNQRLRIHPDQRERTINCSVSYVGVGNSFLDPGPSKLRHEHQFTMGDDTSPTFLPDTGGKKVHNVGNETTVEGKNTWDDSRVVMRGVAFNSEVTEKCVPGPCAPQPKEQPSLRGENKINGCNMLQRCCEGSYAYMSGRCCTAPSVWSNRECYSKDTSCMKGLEKQVSIAVVEAPKFDGSRLSNNSAPIEKAVIVDCSQKMNEQMHEKRECMYSQWRDVPPKANPVSKLGCPNALGKLLDKSQEAESHVEEVAKDISSDQVADLQGNQLSNISFGSFAPATTQASIEVDKLDSCTVDARDTGNGYDQIVDQASLIELSCSSVDAIDSVKSSQHVCCGKARSAEEESPAKFPNVGSHGLADGMKQRHLKSKKLQTFGDSGAGYGEVSNTVQKNENEFTPTKRKHSLEWKTLGTSLAVSHVSLLPSESQLHTRNACDNRAHASEDQGFLQSNSSNIFDANIKHCNLKRRRSALYSVKALSRKRDLNGMHYMFESRSGDQRPLREDADSVEIPESIAVKRVRQIEPAESIVKPVKAAEVAKQVCLCNSDSDGTLNCSLQSCQKPSLVGQNGCNLKTKPVACGKYGIICNRELDLDQLKPPKIVSLSQVLKSSRRLSNFEKEHTLASMRNMVHLSDGRKNICGSLASCNRQVSKLLSCEISAHDTLQKYHKEDAVLADDCSGLRKVVANGSRRNASFLSSHPSAQSKPKEIRVRSLYELSVKGKEFLSADFTLCQTVVSTECESDREASKGAGGSDGGKCSSVARRSLGKASCSSLISELDALCCVCGMSSKDSSNCLLECGRCFLRVHQACYGISRVSKGDWYCRPCKTGAKNVACVICGYGGGAMTRAFGSRGVVKSLLRAWNIRTESHIRDSGAAEMLYVPAKMEIESARFQPSSIKPVVHNSIISGLFDRTVRQWVHLVCGLWTPGTRCPNGDTMSAFDVSGVSLPKADMVCHICKRPGGPCTRCHVETCSSYFHPWCAHQKGLLQREVEGVNNYKAGFYGRCLVHVNDQSSAVEIDNVTYKIDSVIDDEKEPTCARTEVYRHMKLEGGKRSSHRYSGKGKCLVTQVQLDAWLYINRQKLGMKRRPKPPVSDAGHDYRNEYARYKQAKGWKQLVVYKSGIHALGLYTSQFIPCGTMVVEYVGEIVGPRVADKRESEYLSGRKLQYKGACYFFRIDKEQIVDATRKGGIARFVNHSCQPNCAAKVIYVRSEKKVVFFAQRDIYPGEEITYDYHFNNEDEGKKIPCFCKSSNCRRYLN